VVGWALALTGWLGLAWWYVGVLGGDRPSGHALACFACLALTQAGRLLLARAAPGPR
jgi:hypothetical protein